jgi:hypothetical protein
MNAYERLMQIRREQRVDDCQGNPVRRRAAALDRGLCSSCGSPYQAGDQVRLDGAFTRHEACAEADYERRVARQGAPPATSSGPAPRWR